MTTTPPDETPKNSFKKIIILIAILLAFFLMLTCSFQLRNTQAAVVTTFEKPVSTITTAGLHFKYPWPIQKAYIFDLRSRVYQSPLLEYLIEDGYNIVVRLFTVWSIEDIDTYKNRVGVTEQRGEEMVANLVNKHLKIILNTHRFSDFISITKNSESNLSKIEAALLKRIQTEAKKEYGINVSAVGFDRLELPESVTKAVFERMKSERETMVQVIQNESNTKANEIRRKAQSERNKILSEAKMKASKIRGEADTLVFKYLDVYKNNPDFALFLRKLEALKRTTAKKTTIILDKKTAPFDLLMKKITPAQNSKTK